MTQSSLTAVQCCILLFLKLINQQHYKSYEMSTIDQLDRLKVNEVFHESIERPFLFVYPDSKLLEVATFLAIGPEIYVDGLVVVAVELNSDGKRIRTPIGRIGGRNVLSRILDSAFSHQKDFLLHVTASQIMTETVESECVELDSPLSKVIDVFRRTRFGFVPIIQTERVGNNNNKPVILGTLTLRDFLPLIVNKKIGIGDYENEKAAVNQVSSPLVSVDKNTTIRKAISIMINKGIRNIGVENSDRDCRYNNKEKAREKDQGSFLRIVNDRTIMEFLLSQKCRKTAKPNFGIISDLDMIPMYETKNDITVREAAQYLMNVKNPCLLLGGKNSIVTPWDLVIRAIGKAN
jgi:CBS domain-containing protein